MSERRGKVVKTLTGGVAGLFKKNEIDVIEGHGAVTDDGNVKVGGNFDGSEIEAKRCVILATGSVPKPIPGTQFGGRVIGTEEAWAFDELPKTLAVVGAGASGAEIASAYGRLGVRRRCCSRRSTACCRPRTPTSPRPPGASSGKQNIAIHTGTLVENVEAGDDGREVHVRRPVRRGRVPLHRRRPRARRRGPGPRRGGRQARRRTA